MRFMLLLKANSETEAGVPPSQKVLEAMLSYNEELSKAGALLAGEGLQPSSKGARVMFSGKKRTVTDGPFPEAKELVAGYWIIQANSLEEAIEWTKKVPIGRIEDETYTGDTVIEIRPLFEVEDFDAATPELRAKEQLLRSQGEARQ